MCGIVGYVGEKNATPVLVNALKKLEYRGYDSAGIAVFNGEDILVRKVKGAIRALVENVTKQIVRSSADMSDEDCDKRESELVMQMSGFIPGFMGIGHTRWATHGEHRHCKPFWTRKDLIYENIFFFRARFGFGFWKCAGIAFKHFTATV